MKPSSILPTAATLALVGLAASGCTPSAAHPLSAPTPTSASALPAAGPASASAPTSGAGAAGRTTTVTFTPEQAQSRAELGVIADRLRQRAKTSGLDGLQVRVAGQRISVSADGDQRSRLTALGQPGLLYMRPVVASAPSGVAGSTAVTGTVPGALAPEFTPLDCQGLRPGSHGPDSPTAQVVACAAQAQDSVWYKYVLGPVALAGADVSSSTARRSTNGAGWVVELAFDARGTAEFASVTSRLAAQGWPQDQFAVEVDGAVLSAPGVSSAITGGKAEISGNFTQAQARDLAAQLTTGSLPVLRTDDTTLTG